MIWQAIGIGWLAKARNRLLVWAQMKIWQNRHNSTWLNTPCVECAIGYIDVCSWSWAVFTASIHAQIQMGDGSIWKRQPSVSCICGSHAMHSTAFRCSIHLGSLILKIFECIFHEWFVLCTPFLDIISAEKEMEPFSTPLKYLWQYKGLYMRHWSLFKLRTHFLSLFPVDAVFFSRYEISMSSGVCVFLHRFVSDGHKMEMQTALCICTQTSWWRWNRNNNECTSWQPMRSPSTAMKASPLFCTWVGLIFNYCGHSIATENPMKLLAFWPTIFAHFFCRWGCCFVALSSCACVYFWLDCQTSAWVNCIRVKYRHTLCVSHFAKPQH